MGKRFSDRHGYAPADQPIVVREDAPVGLRYALAQIAYDAGIRPSPLRKIICQILRVPPDPSNWSDFPNIDWEVRQHLAAMPWYRVYDIAEAVYSHLFESREDAADLFAAELNGYFRENGIGWQMVDGEIQMRGDSEFEQTVTRVLDRLGEKEEHPTAESELREARRDLSRRPKPDLTGAVQHTMGSLEALARELTGDHKATFGQLIPRLTAIPKPLDVALEKVWGYASNTARHVREGGTPTQQEAELILSLTASVMAYLLEHSAKRGQSP